VAGVRGMLTREWRMTQKDQKEVKEDKKVKETL
jgi:hypothetical protein